jgi:hypothetical protein
MAVAMADVEEDAEFIEAEEREDPLIDDNASSASEDEPEEVPSIEA